MGIASISQPSNVPAQVAVAGDYHECTHTHTHTHVYASHFHLGAIIDATYHLTHFTYIYLVTLGTPE